MNINQYQSDTYNHRCLFFVHIPLCTHSNQISLNGKSRDHSMHGVGRRFKHRWAALLRQSPAGRPRPSQVAVDAERPKRDRASFPGAALVAAA